MFRQGIESLQLIPVIINIIVKKQVFLPKLYTLIKISYLMLFFSIVKVRETRLTGLLSSILIALSLLMLPTPLKLVPTPVLDGLFLFMAITALDGNQMFERALLLITEQVKKCNTFTFSLRSLSVI